MVYIADRLMLFNDDAPGFDIPQPAFNLWQGNIKVDDLAQ